MQEYSCEFGSGKYFALCGLGGILSCGTTHTAVVPLDLVKCRIQVDPAKYGGIIKGFRVSLKEAGVRELGKGWAPTFFGYSMQGLGKFGLYEVFKIYYSRAMGEVNIIYYLFIRAHRSRSAASYSYQTFPWTICQSVCLSVCPVHCGKTADWNGIVGRTGPGRWCGLAIGPR